VNESARPADTSDADACAELCRNALDALASKRGGEVFSQRESGALAKAFMRPGGLSRLLSDPRRRVLVGTIDQAVVGLATGRVEAVGEASMGVVDGLYVEPPSRGIGVGTRLLEGLVGFFEASGCGAVDATALPGDRDTKNFFEGAGFKARLLTMHKPLG